MFSLIKLDIINCIKNKKFTIVFLIFFSLSFLHFLLVSLYILKDTSAITLFSSDLSLVDQYIGGDLFNLYIILIPFTVNFIFSDSFSNEYSSNIHSNLIVRKGLKSYVYSKAIVTFLTTFLTIFLTLYINKLLIGLLSLGVSTSIEHSYSTHTHAYNYSSSLIIIVNSIIASLISLTTLVITIYFKHIKPIIIFVIISSIFFFSSIILGIFNMDSFNLYYYQQGVFDPKIALPLLTIWLSLLFILLKVKIKNYVD